MYACHKNLFFFFFKSIIIILNIQINRVAVDRYMSECCLRRMSSSVCWMPNPLVQRSPLFLSNQIQLYKPGSTGIAGVILLADARVHPATGAPRAWAQSVTPPKSHPDTIMPSFSHTWLKLVCVCVCCVFVIFSIYLCIHFYRRRMAKVVFICKLNLKSHTIHTVLNLFHFSCSPCNFL